MVHVGVEGLYRIGELAKLAGVNKSAIDHYTRLGLIEPAQRSGGSYRLYSDEALETLKFIGKCKENRLSLTEIQEVIKSEPTVEQADVCLCIKQATMAMDKALEQINSIEAKLEQVPGHDLEAIRMRAGLLTMKVLALSELLRITSQQL